MSAPPLRTVEDTRVFTTLGIRFWDAAFDVPIHVPLVVHAWLPEGPFPPVRAVRSPSGVYSFHALPGRAAAEYPGGEEHPEDLGPELDYVIVVDDPGGRFLPAAFTLALPLGFRGVFPDDAIASEPGGAPPRAYLFPSPAYPVPPGAAAIRVDLLDADTDPDEPEPAAWAVVRATLEGRELTGIADESGRVLLLAALPLVERLNLGSPPGSGVEPAPGGGPGGGGPGGGPGGGGPGGGGPGGGGPGGGGPGGGGPGGGGGGGGGGAPGGGDALSPPQGDGLTDVSWPVTVRVEYTPGALRWPLQEAFALPAAWRETPSLKSVLHEQFPGLITTDEGAAPVSEFEAELGYGEPLVLRTRDAGGTPLATLWVHAGASTP